MAAALALTAGIGTSAFAGPPDPARPAGHSPEIVPVHGNVHAASRTSNAGNLLYHSGPVQHGTKVYAIYWIPSGTTLSVDSGYEPTIDRYFADVAADSGKTTNVYYSDTQYYDGAGNIPYNVTFGGSVVATDPLPARGCSDSVTPSYCLSDAQVQSEISRVVTAQGWPRGTGAEYFMFTARGIGSCLASNECAFTYYCAYHSNIGTGSSAILYANMPYADTDARACGTGERPNGTDADDTLNVTSHENNETITDPFGTAWFDRQGAENGDKCAWTFGSALGGSAGALYNQSINGDHYYLQREWSNNSSGCVLTGT
jgi:hypothetical protein